MPLEGKINDKASNDWLKIKKEKYRDSKIALVLNFEKTCGDTWDVSKIKDRDNEIAKLKEKNDKNLNNEQDILSAKKTLASSVINLININNTNSEKSEYIGNLKKIMIF